MRCYICDSVLSAPVWNGQLKAFEPCPTCMDIIHHVFEDTPEPLSVEEESLDDAENDNNSESYGDSYPEPDEFVRKEDLAR